jgi:hypothetical protein
VTASFSAQTNKQTGQDCHILAACLCKQVAISTPVSAKTFSPKHPCSSKILETHFFREHSERINFGIPGGGVFWRENDQKSGAGVLTCCENHGKVTEKKDMLKKVKQQSPESKAELGQSRSQTEMCVQSDVKGQKIWNYAEDFHFVMKNAEKKHRKSMQNFGTL